MNRRRPHDGWAAHYDLALEATFAEAYQAFTNQTLAIIRRIAAPPARIVDFGAGTGRISHPLAGAGFVVTAVDPARAMLDRLEEKSGSESIEIVHSSMADYTTDVAHDLALCVFTVLAYLLDKETLGASFQAAATALRPGGLMLLDIPGGHVFEGFEIENESIIRCVEIDPREDGLFQYRERTAVRSAGDTLHYTDVFTLRHWTRDEVDDAISSAGFRVTADFSADFADWGGAYLLLERPF